MRVENGIVYNVVTYPKEVLDVYKYAIDNDLDGYSVHTKDGRYFKWNPDQSKAEYLDNANGIVYLKAINVKSINEVKEETKSIKTQSLVEKVKAIKVKIASYQNEIKALNNTISSQSAEKIRLENTIATKDNEINALNQKIDTLIKENSELKNTIEAIAEL